MKNTLLFLLSFLLIAAASAQTVNQIASTGNGNVYAVVIGVSNYQDPDVPKLRFANRDAGIFADFLQSKAGGSVPKENIRLLIDSSATVSAVHMAIRWLTRTCKKGDIVFFYFSGHGDLESISMFNNAYLICYNTPIESYVGMSLSVTFLNEVANTLSAQTEAKVVLITDACHSGKMAGRENVNALVGKQLLNATENEIRIASSQADQLSNENVDWGGGRGVFSYYLLNGLKGLADGSKDGIITLGEIRAYLQNYMGNDPVLKREGKTQTPVFKGGDNFELARVDNDEAVLAKSQAILDSVAHVLLSPAPMVTNDEISGMMADDYFLSVLKTQGLETFIDSLGLDTYTAKQVPVILLKTLRDTLQNKAGVAKLNELLAEIEGSPDAVNRINEMLVMAFDDKVQEVINRYLKGDEAELERRRYYNVANNGYDIYPRMLEVAMRLTDPSGFYYNMLRVKRHYFTGVTLRLKIPLSPAPAELIEQAFTEQQKALAIEKTAPYIYNELGILYMLKKQYGKAEANFREAIRRNDTWSIPLSNLSGLYAITNQYVQGFVVNKKADSLQPDNHNTTINLGLLNERSGNLLYAEEDYRKAIDINDRHYLPFERLGFVYLNMTDYAAADSFFYEADLRKKGYHFKGNAWMAMAPSIVMPPTLPQVCELDTARLNPHDFMAFFYWGIKEYEQKNYANALRILRKVIVADQDNPLVYHYLGKLYYDQEKWEEAEIYFQYAIQYYLDDSSFRQHMNEEIAKATAYGYEHSCFERFYEKHYYEQKEDLYFIAQTYENWNHVEEAEQYYQQIMDTYPSELGGYIKRWNLLERLGRYIQVEDVIKSYDGYGETELVERELNAFYRRMTERYPGEATWHYKLGVLLYGRSADRSMYPYFDTLIWFPQLNREVFVDHEVYTHLGFGEYKMDANVYPDLQTAIKAHKTTEDVMPYRIPGTGVWMPLAEPIYMPRKDGIEYFSRAADRMTDKRILGEINNKIGDIYTWAGSRKRAYPYYKKSVEMEPGNANARLNLVDAGTAIYKDREVFNQLKYLYDSSQINYVKRLTYVNFAMYAGQFDLSQKVLNEAGEMQPVEMYDLLEMQARLYLLSGKTKESVKKYRAYAERVPSVPETEYSLARLYARQGKKSEALQWLGNALKHGFNYSFILAADPDMDSLRKGSQWKTLMKSFQPKEWKKPARNTPAP